MWSAILKEWRSDPGIRAYFGARVLSWRPPVNLKLVAGKRVEPSQTLWGAGDEYGACSLSTLAAAIDRHSQPLEPGVYAQGREVERGRVNCGKHIMEQEASGMMLTSDTRPGARLPPLDLHRTRWQLHPGVCRSKDADVYE